MTIKTDLNNLKETNSPRMREFYEHGLMDIKNRTSLSFKIEK